ncbi:MAG: DNA repair protein RadA, partial [Oscillospiraceae bacterium]|nr:DNA repair protein RadA [Oscillospiraceae bacterium]
RAVKNRFGSTNEIGVFEMMDSGLEQVENPSAMLLSGRPGGVSGCCVACTMEGSRPILAEVQALVTKSGMRAPRIVSTGFDFNRVWMILAVLEKRMGYYFGNLDVYVNIIGGLRITEPAADLPVAMALYSSLTDKAISEDVIAFGEIGLGGELRGVSHLQQRIEEAARLGFTKAIVPRHSIKNMRPVEGIEVVGVSNLKQAFGAIK